MSKTIGHRTLFHVPLTLVALLIASANSKAQEADLDSLINLDPVIRTAVPEGYLATGQDYYLVDGDRYTEVTAVNSSNGDVVYLSFGPDGRAIEEPTRF